MKKSAMKKAMKKKKNRQATQWIWEEICQKGGIGLTVAGIAREFQKTRCAVQMVRPMRTPVNWNTSPADDTGLLLRWVKAPVKHLVLESLLESSQVLASTTPQIRVFATTTFSDV